MKRDRKKALLTVLLLAAAAFFLAFFRWEREYVPYEPDTEAIIRSGAVFQKVLRRAANAESSREQAVLELSGKDVDSILTVLQSRLNPLLEKIPHNEHGFFYRLVRNGRNLKFCAVRPLPGRLLFVGGALAAEPKITQEKAAFAVSRAEWGLYPLPGFLVSSRLNAQGKKFLNTPFGKILRAAVISAEVLPDGRWRIVYRPFFAKKAMFR